MKEMNWKKILRQAFSPRKSDARAQEKAATWALGSILVLIFLPLIVLQFAIDVLKTGAVFGMMGMGLVAQEKLGIKNKIAINILMGISIVVSFIAIMALIGFLGRLYRGL